MASTSAGVRMFCSAALASSSASRPLRKASVTSVVSRVVPLFTTPFSGILVRVRVRVRVRARVRVRVRVRDRVRVRLRVALLRVRAIPNPNPNPNP